MMGQYCIAPRSAGLISYFLGDADTPFGVPHWKGLIAATTYASDMQDYLTGMECSVVDDSFMSSDPLYRYKVLCCWDYYIL